MQLMSSFGHTRWAGLLSIMQVEYEFVVVESDIVVVEAMIVGFDTMKNFNEETENENH